MNISTGWMVAGGIAAGAAAIGGIAWAVSASGKKDQDADRFAVDRFGHFDRAPQDNQWTPHETNYTTVPRLSTREVNTYRIGDYVYGTREIRQTTTSHSMSRIYEAARGNDAVLSLQELRDFALRNFDRDGSGGLNRSERNRFDDVYGATSRSRTVIVGHEPFARWSPRDDRSFPDPDYPHTPSRPNGPGDDGGGRLPPYNGGNGPGDEGSFIPPSSGGNGPGDEAVWLGSGDPWIG